MDKIATINQLDLPKIRISIFERWIQPDGGSSGDKVAFSDPDEVMSSAPVSVIDWKYSMKFLSNA